MELIAVIPLVIDSIRICGFTFRLPVAMHFISAVLMVTCNRITRFNAPKWQQKNCTRI